MNTSKNNLALITGNAHPELAKDIAEILKVPLLKADVGSFLDGETMVANVGETRDQDVYIIQPTGQPDRNQTEIELLADAVVRSAQRVTAVIPYFGYARQDRRDESRVPVSVKVMLRNLVNTGLDRLVFLNLHNTTIPSIAEAIDRRIKVDHLNARPVLLEWLILHGLKKVILSSADEGGFKLVLSHYKRLLSKIGEEKSGDKTDLEFGVGFKIGTSSIGIERTILMGDFKERDVFFIDDMTTSGSTLVKASVAAKKKGARRVICIVIHPVLANEKVCRDLAEAPIDLLVTTDSLPIPEGYRKIFGEKLRIVTISKLLALAIWHLHNNMSMTQLFELDGYQESYMMLQKSC